MQYWIMKSEPSDYSIDDLERDGQEPWDGVRNYQARNFMRDDMRIGDTVFFYHSNVPEPGIVGEARVCSEAYPDPTAFDPTDKHYDPKSDPKKPRWMLVDVCYVRTYPRTITIGELRDDPKLKGLRVAQRGNRLSITPVETRHARHIQSLVRR
jgi:predicted RNA-binding protein with PUA-like domain